MLIAKNAGRAEDAARLALEVEESQKACPHSKADVHVYTAPTDIDTAHRGLIHQGDQVVGCLGCSYIIRHTPKGQ